jgi:hypothetical protein
MLKREFLGNGVILLLRPTHNNQIKKDMLRMPIIQSVMSAIGRKLPVAELKSAILEG